MPFQIIRNDITKVKADAIVNTANPEVAIGDGVDCAIYEAAGAEDLFAARQKIGELSPGEVGITPAFNLPAKYVIHSSDPWWQGGSQGEADLLRQCYDRSLELAYKNKCKSIAFPLMATGTYGFPKEVGLQIAVDSFKDFLEDHEMEITLVVFTDYAYKVSGDIYDTVESFIDGRYVDEALDLEYPDEGIPDEFAYPSEEEDERGSLPDIDAVEGRPAPISFVGAGSILGSVGLFRKSEAAPAKEKKSLDSKLKGIYTDSFEKHLQQLINKKRLKNAEVNCSPSSRQLKNCSRHFPQFNPSLFSSLF